MENYPRQLVSGDNACTKGTNMEPSQTHYTSTKHMLHTVMPTSIPQTIALSVGISGYQSNWSIKTPSQVKNCENDYKSSSNNIDVGKEAVVIT